MSGPAGARDVGRCFPLDLMNRGALSGYFNVSAVNADGDADTALGAVRRSVEELKPVVEERAPTSR
ncbi:MAG: hypothetical protein ACE5OO_06485 [Candidatus Bathyarchaeia archaeon]